MASSVVGLVEQDRYPWVDVRRVARLFGAQIIRCHLGVTVWRRGTAGHIEDVIDGPRQTIWAPVEAVACALMVPVFVHTAERIIRIGRNEPRLRQAHVGVVALDVNSTVTHATLMRLSKGVAARVVGWLRLHGTKAYVLKSRDIGQSLRDGAVTLGIQYALSKLDGQRSEAFYADPAGEHLATSLQYEVVSATGRPHGGVSKIASGDAHGAVGGVASVIRPASIREDELIEQWMNPWRMEREALGIFCGVRRFLDERTEW